MIEKQIFKVEAQGDTVYINCETEDDARLKLREAFGFIPEKYLTFTVVEDLPSGEDFL